MSLLFYFASNNPLKESPNPYVKMLSIHEAKETGMGMNDWEYDNRCLLIGK